jgi:hypothetical protein
MSPLTQDLSALGGAFFPAARRTTARWLGWLKHWQEAASMRRTTARAEAAQARVIAAARDACAVEGATTEFDVVVFDGQRYGAVYVDGKLNCLLPGLERL